MSAADRPSPAAAERRSTAGWKGLLALITLALSLLLWLNGLLGSLSRPSVLDTLSLRQLELVALASDAVPPPLRPLLTGEDPRADLAKELERQISEARLPAPALERLELALLKGSDPVAEARLRELVAMVDAPRRPLLEALISARRLDPEVRSRLLAPWKAPAMVVQLSCERLGGESGTCPAERDRRGLLLRLVAVNVIPALLVLLGTGLLAREGWRLWKERLGPAPPLQGPPLSLVDVTLVIAGGFVLIGELFLPVLVQPALEAVLQRLPAGGERAGGLQVVLLYALLTTAPLLMLWAMLRRRHPPIVGGWLQWYWRPPGSALRQAIHTLLMVMPLVALTGWLIEQLWRDAGGSNPLLEQVIASRDPFTLACFAFTALLLAPLFEETLFRGVLLPVLAERFGGAAGVLISAGVFAVAHLSLSELAPLFVLGLGLGWLRWRSGRLSSCALLHGLWNGLTFTNLLLLAG